MHKDINVNVSGPMQPTSTYKTKVLKGNHSFASQVTEPNTKYVIKHNFDLGGGSVTIPEGCLLEFDGGAISNGTLVGQSTILIYNQPLNDILTATLEGTWRHESGVKADEEDITDLNGELKFKDKAYAPANYSGLGRKILRKNIVNGVNTLTQSMINQTNTIYVIQYDFVLGENITVPANCVLEFDGGSISGAHTLTGNNTGIEAGLVKIFNTDVTLAGTWNVSEAYPEWFGAKGDGVTDDTDAIQKTLGGFPILALGEYKEYYVTTTIICPRTKSINGNRASLKIDSSFVESNIGASVPSTTILFVQGADNMYDNNTELMASYIKDLKIYGNRDNSVGIFVGTEDKDSVTTISNEPYSIEGYNFDNIFITSCYTAFHIQDCWNSYFNNCVCNNIKYRGILIAGQVINCVFSGCRIYCRGEEGSKAIEINSIYYNGNQRKPEGCSFIGGFYGSAETGIYIYQCEAVNFTDCIIDLNTLYGVSCVSPIGVTIKSCYIYANPSNTNSIGVFLAELGSINNFNRTYVTGCIINAYRPISVKDNQNDVTFISNQLKGTASCIFLRPGTFTFVNNNYSNSNLVPTITSPKCKYLLFGNILDKDTSDISNIYDVDKKLKGKPDISKILIDGSSNPNKYFELFIVSSGIDSEFLFTISDLSSTNNSYFILRISNNGTINITPIRHKTSYSYTALYYYKDSNNKTHICFKTGNYYAFVSYLCIGNMSDSFTVVNALKTSEYEVTQITDNNVVDGSVFNNNGVPTVKQDGLKNIAYNISGTTRPTTSVVGFIYFDESLNPKRPIWWNGSAWVDATGATV